MLMTVLALATLPTRLPTDLPTYQPACLPANASLQRLSPTALSNGSLQSDLRFEKDEGSRAQGALKAAEGKLGELTVSAQAERRLLEGKSAAADSLGKQLQDCQVGTVILLYYCFTARWAGCHKNTRKMLI